MKKTIMIISRYEAENYKEIHGSLPERPYAYLSISDHPDHKAESPLIDGENCKGCLQLSFMDNVDEDYEFMGIPSIRDEQAKEIADFILSVWDIIEIFISQCEAGISRSAAVAKIIDDVMNGGAMDINPPLYHPNPLVYAKIQKFLNAGLNPN